MFFFVEKCNKCVYHENTTIINSLNILFVILSLTFVCIDFEK